MASRRKSHTERSQDELDAEWLRDRYTEYQSAKRDLYFAGQSLSAALTLAATLSPGSPEFGVEISRARRACDSLTKWSRATHMYRSNVECALAVLETRKRTRAIEQLKRTWDLFSKSSDSAALLSALRLLDLSGLT